jgi:cytochrome c oxidase cbb3-type subunit 3
MADNVHNQGVRTTGHVWDETLQEYNNPLPVWWTYAFYVTILFGLVYWFIYPSWPVGKSFLSGFGSVTYTNAEGQSESWHWNTRAKLLLETQEAAARQKPYFDKLASLPYEQIAKDPELSSFVVSAGKPLFADNCAACHQAGGAGQVGHYPNLTDDDWLYGGTPARIEETLRVGRRGYMPAFREVLSGEQIDSLAHYVLTLSGHKADTAKAEAGKHLFHSNTASCFYCHGDEAKGNQAVGGANLTDKVWMWANLPAAKDDAERFALVRGVIAGGLDRGVMPAWEGRLRPEQIKLLTAYVHGLGGGK